MLSNAELKQKPIFFLHFPVWISIQTLQTVKKELIISTRNLKAISVAVEQGIVIGWNTHTKPK